jgi:GMP synthase-like glutamine amidotransferase
MKWLKKFENAHRFMDESIKEIFPKLVKIYSTTGNFTLTLADFTREGNVIKADYYHSTYKESNPLRDGEPDFLIFDFYFVNNEAGLKTIVDITYGDSTKYAFSIEAPNKITITHYNGIDSLLDSDTQFGFEDETILDLVKLFNNFSTDYDITKEDLVFLDKYPDTFDPKTLEFVPDTKKTYNKLDRGLELPTNSERPDETALSHGKKVLVINNSKPPKHRYLNNLLKYLQLRGINNVVVSNIDELGKALSKYKFSCVISTGSENMVSDDDATKMTYQVLDNTKVPYLGICFGFQSLSKYYGSKIGTGDFTHQNKNIDRREHPLFNDLFEDEKSFSFSFNDYPENCPEGFSVICTVDGKIAGIANDKLKRYGVLFHPEDIEYSYKVLDNFIGLTDNQSVEQDKLKLGKFESLMRFKDFKRMN